MVLVFELGPVLNKHPCWKKLGIQFGKDFPGFTKQDLAQIFGASTGCALILFPWRWRTIYPFCSSIPRISRPHVCSSCFSLLCLINSSSSHPPGSHFPNLVSPVQMIFGVDPFPGAVTGGCLCQQVSP